MFLVFEHRDLAIPFQSSCALFSNKAPLPRTSRSCHLNLNSPLDSGSHFGGRGGAGARSERGNCSAKLLHSSIATSSFLAYINILERWQGKVSSSSGTWREGSQERVSGGAGGGKAGRRLAGSQGTPEVRRLPVITATRGPQLQNVSVSSPWGPVPAGCPGQCLDRDERTPGHSANKRSSPKPGLIFKLKREYSPEQGLEPWTLRLKV